MYSNDNGKEFGYKEDDAELLAQNNRYNLFNHMFAARGCKSGMAVVDKAANKMTCAEIAYIKSDFDNYGSILSSPFYCKLPEDDGFVKGTA